VTPLPALNLVERHFRFLNFIRGHTMRAGARYPASDRGQGVRVPRLDAERVGHDQLLVEFVISGMAERETALDTVLIGV